MSKTAFVILASADNPESLGRVVNALMAAHEQIESGQDVKIIFDGAGPKAAATSSAEHDRYHGLFKLVKSKLSGVCRYCAKAYGVAHEIEEAALPFANEVKHHPSFKKLIEQQYQILIF